MSRKGSIAARARAGLERAVLGKQSLYGSAVDADDGPVGLFAGKAARVMATRCFVGDGREEGIGRGAEGKILDLDLRRCRTPSPGRRSSAGADNAISDSGQQVRIGSAVAVHDLPHRAPVRAVVGELDVVARSVQHRVASGGRGRRARVADWKSIVKLCAAPAAGSLRQPVSADPSSAAARVRSGCERRRACSDRGARGRERCARQFAERQAVRSRPILSRRPDRARRPTPASPCVAARDRSSAPRRIRHACRLKRTRCHSCGNARSGRFTHHTFSPLASMSLNWSVLGGASPRRPKTNSKFCGKSSGSSRRATA